MPHVSHTHLRIDEGLCGRIAGLGEGTARVELELSDVMRADEHGLIHGGFVFGAADYAAMLAVNEPNVVLGAAEVKFLKPSRVGETIVLEAQITETSGRKREVSVTGSSQQGEPIFAGRFVCFVPDRHVLLR